MNSPPDTTRTPASPALVPPLAAIVGRPNVGKSALFNRMVGQRKSLVEDLPGTTRDRLYGEVTWNGECFRLADTGGLEPEAEEGYPEQIRLQVEQAVAEANVLIFVVDAKVGITPLDEEVADVLRRAEKRVFLVANKAETDARLEEVVQFYELGLGEPIPVSAQHGIGVAEVMDMVLEALPPVPEQPVAVVPRLAIIGRPNVGKSLLLNAILGEDRVIVSETPGTTRDAIDTTFQFEDQPLVLVDTAGLRRRGKMERGLEQHASLRAHRALGYADTALVLFDASEGITAQDLHIIGYALDAKTGLIVVPNKWDLVPGTSPADFEREVRARLQFAPWASFRIISAKERVGITPLLREALRIYEDRQRRIGTGTLNAVIQRATDQRPPPRFGTRQPKLFYAYQSNVSPPTFVFFVNHASWVHFSYRRFLENVVRKHFGFQGVALRLTFRSRREEH